MFRQIWESIAEDLKQGIIRGELKGGQRLRIDELSLKYGVSNTPIRDAFRYLANLGFVENIPRRMVVVREIRLKEVEDIYEIQGVLEGLAAGLAARRCSPDECEQLAALCCQMERCANEKDIAGYSAADIEFHALFVRLSGNPRLIHMVENARDHINRFRFLMLRSPGRLEQSMEEHRRIIAAFAERDAEAVDRAVKTHVAVSAELLKGIVSHRGEASLGAAEIA